MGFRFFNCSQVNNLSNIVTDWLRRFTTFLVRKILKLFFYIRQGKKLFQCVPNVEEGLFRLEKIFTRLRQCSENGREKFSPTLLSLLGRLRRTENALRGTTRTAAHHVLLSCARIVHQKHVSFEGFSCWMPLTCNCFVYVRWLECRWKIKIRVVKSTTAAIVVNNCYSLYSKWFFYESAFITPLRRDCIEYVKAIVGLRVVAIVYWVYGVRLEHEITFYMTLFIGLLRVTKAFVMFIALIIVLMTNLTFLMKTAVSVLTMINVSIIFTWLHEQSRLDCFFLQRNYLLDLWFRNYNFWLLQYPCTGPLVCLLALKLSHSCWRSHTYSNFTRPGKLVALN